jgi:hypothetical protein
MVESARHVARRVGQGVQPVASRPVAQYETHENIARIDRAPLYVAKTPANRDIPTRSISERHFRERSVTIPWWSVTHGNTDRMKVLQTAHYQWRGRCGRYFANSCGIGSSSCPLSVPSSDDQGAFTAAFNACVADERTVDGPGT